MNSPPKCVSRNRTHIAHKRVAQNCCQWAFVIRMHRQRRCCVFSPLAPFIKECQKKFLFSHRFRGWCWCCCMCAPQQKLVCLFNDELEFKNQFNRKSACFYDILLVCVDDDEIRDICVFEFSIFSTIGCPSTLIWSDGNEKVGTVF